MTRRLIWFLICAISGVLLVVDGLLVPAHLRAVEASVLQEAGRNSASLIDQGVKSARQNNIGSAQMLLQAAQQGGLPDQQRLSGAISDLVQQHPRWVVWGGGDPRLERLFTSDPHLPKTASEPFTDFVVREDNRSVLFDLLKGSELPSVQELLRCRTLTNTVIFSPSQSASGQALDTALVACGLLLERRCLSGGLSNAVFHLALESTLDGESQRLEQVLLDLMSLGQRFNWDQLAAFTGQIQDPETLRLLTSLVRQDDAKIAPLFAAVQLSGKPAQVAGYLMSFSQSGRADLGASLRFGVGGVKELLQRNQRLSSSLFRQNLAEQTVLSPVLTAASQFCWRMPRLALTIKWLFYLAGGFLLAAAVHFARPAVSVLEQPLQVRGFHIAREILFALGFLLVVLLLSEPFLAQDTQRLDTPFRLRLPRVGSVAPAVTPSVSRSIMNQLSLLTLLLFFVLQALIYTACLFKLAEIRRQNLSSRVRLKLLENEDHLFDAGLYLGFAGTIISLILVSLGVIQPSLMAAYSSTSFGIIFVSVFKIFHLRPLRRKLLLEAEAAHDEYLAGSVTPRLATPS
ncbi:MAG: hypothetical protein NT154_03865 [Verrucomicrobia bacterium]|nr:hypothetical protein [Verrucomicrobiota bacterium]